MPVFKNIACLFGYYLIQKLYLPYGMIVKYLLLLNVLPCTYLLFFTLQTIDIPVLTSPT